VHIDRRTQHATSTNWYIEITTKLQSQKHLHVFHFFVCFSTKDKSATCQPFIRRCSWDGNTTFIHTVNSHTTTVMAYKGGMVFSTLCLSMQQSINCARYHHKIFRESCYGQNIATFWRTGRSRRCMRVLWHYFSTIHVSEWVSEQILGKSAQLGYTVPFMSVNAGKCRTEDKINKKAQLMLAYPRDAKTMKKFPHFEVITSSSQVGNPVFIVIKFLIQITSTYNNS